MSRLVKIQLTCLFTLLGLFASGPALPTAMTGASIQQILIHDSWVYVYPTVPIPNRPACAGSNNYYSFSMTRSRAKEFLAGLLAAQVQKATINIWGTGLCTDQSTSETLSYFLINTPPDP
jgi:hypothetical protein